MDVLSFFDILEGIGGLGLCEFGAKADDLGVSGVLWLSRRLVIVAIFTESSTAVFVIDTD